MTRASLPSHLNRPMFCLLRAIYIQLYVLLILCANDIYSTSSFCMVNRLNDLRYTMDSKRKAVHGESIGKAVRDLMRLSSGLEYLKYIYTSVYS